MLGYIKKFKNDKRYKIILWGLLVHFLLLIACFDLYFASPLDHGMTPVRSTTHSPAKRVVLYVADGLRAEAIYGENKEDRTPFLTNVLKTRGSWGISHTRVPTESRPGHVAMLAGIYEDPSAILKGWKANPVDFDSVINQSRNAWCWGSPDIVNIFNKDHLPHIHLFVYGAEMEDFGKRNSSLLDTWVFDRVERFLNQDVRSCLKNCDKYYEEGTIFFLHLLGIDTAGHGFKPHSNEYINNIKLVDESVEKITKLFENVFQDNSTAYVFTADHGMTDWGSHGAGTLHETESPIIAWGSGIDSNSYRQDINQIDMAPLLASLIGINIPINSLGITPLNYLDVEQKDRALILLANTMQLLEIFNVKRWRAERNAIAFVPFRSITSEIIDGELKELRMLFSAKQYDALEVRCQDFIRTLIDGLEYYHNYYQKAVLTAVTVGFVAWIVFLALSVMVPVKETVTRNAFMVHDYAFFAAAFFIGFLCYIQRFSFTYYLYFQFPAVMIHTSLQEYNSISAIRQQFQQASLRNILGNVAFYFVGVEFLVIGFFYRLAYSFLMLLVAVSVILSQSLKNTTSFNEKVLWIFFCVLLSIFPSLPVMKTSFNVPLYILGFFVWLLMFLEMYMNRLKVYFRVEHITVEYRVFAAQFVCLLLAGVYVLALEYELIAEDSSIKYMSWFLLFIPISLVPLTSKVIVLRLTATFFAFAPFYLLVSPSFEVLFSAFYVSMLFLWLLIECKSFHYGNSSNLIYYSKFVSYKTKDKFQTDSFRRAFLFMIFIFVGFFGTGNIASLNSFDPMWVRAFLTVFSPFKMMGLILLKLMVPFIFTCCVFRAINSVGKENILSMFCIILMFSDVMVLQFLYLVTNQGSWLDIGTSLSHFIIMEAFVTILLLLYGFAHVITTISFSR